MEKNPYIYFVSYSHSTGVGRCSVERKAPIDSIEEIEKVEGAIMDSNKLVVDVLVMNFQLLRQPPETHYHIVQDAGDPDAGK